MINLKNKEWDVTINTWERNRETNRERERDYKINITDNVKVAIFCSRGKRVVPFKSEASDNLTIMIVVDSNGPTINIVWKLWFWKPVGRVICLNISTELFRWTLIFLLFYSKRVMRLRGCVSGIMNFSHYLYGGKWWWFM